MKFEELSYNKKNYARTCAKHTMEWMWRLFKFDGEEFVKEVLKDRLEIEKRARKRHTQNIKVIKLMQKFLK